MRLGQIVVQRSFTKTSRASGLVFRVEGVLASTLNPKRQGVVFRVQGGLA